MKYSSYEEWKKQKDEEDKETLGFFEGLDCLEFKDDLKYK